MKIAQIQMHVSADKAENIRHACDLVRSAGDIDLAVLPEMFCCPYDNACFRDYGEHLLFAGTNEPNVTNTEQMIVLQSYLQTFIDAVRATEGNNSLRNLIIQGPSTDI